MTNFTPARPLRLLSALACLAVTAFPACAQSEAPKGGDPIKVFHLANVGQADDAKEILNALRNMMAPTDKVYLLFFTNDIVVEAPQEEINRVGQLIAQLDHPRKSYRLTFTLNESDNGKRLGVQHFTLVTVTGQRLVLKQGDKVPIVTGSFSTEQKAEQTQFTYLDIGMNLDITLDELAGGLRLRSKVDQSSVAAEAQNGKLPNDPIVRQSLLEGTSVLTPGKPLIIGSLDIVGSTRHVDIEVVADPLP